MSPPEHTPYGARYDFAPRRGARRAVGVVLLLALAVTAYAGWRAWEERTTTSVGLLATAGVLTLVLYALRAGSGVRHLSVRGGMLDVADADGHAVFDLVSAATRIEVVGSPDRRGWQVLIDRPTTSPFVIDASMVDPHDFMRVLRAYRPDA